MINPVLHIILFCAILPASKAQTPESHIDSLVHAIQIMPPDTAKVHSLNHLAGQYRSNGGPDLARSALISSIELAKQLGFMRGLAKAHNLNGLIAMDAGMYAIALAHQDSAMAIYRDIGDHRSICNILSNIGSVNFQKNNYIEALHYFNKAQKLSSDEGAWDIQMIACVNIGSVYGAQSNYPEATRYFLMALSLARALNNKYAMGVILSNIGVVYNYQKQPGEALKYYKECLSIMEDLNNKEGLAMVYDKIGAIESHNDNYPGALDYFLKSLQLYESLGRKKQSAMVKNHIGSAYLGIKDFDHARSYFQFALEERTLLGDKEGMAESMEGLYRITLAEAETLEGTEARTKYQEATENIFTSLKLNEEVGYIEGIKGNYKNLVTAYTGLNDYKKAFKYMEQYIALKDSVMNNETNRRLEQLRMQFEVEKAVTAEKVKQDSLLAMQKLESEKELAERKAKHQLEIAEAKAQEERAIDAARYRYLLQLTAATTEQEKELALQQFEHDLKIAEESTRHKIALAEEKAKQQRTESEAKARLKNESEARQKRSLVFASGGGLLSLFGLFGFLFHRQRSLKYKAIERAETIHKLNELELQSLRAQLNPHFMFNSLNAIQELILMEDNDRSHTYLARFAKLLRMLLENANSPFIPLAREMEFLDLYLSLEKLRIPDLQYNVDVDPGINMNEIYIPNMILQPYIENAIWHGLSHKAPGDRVIRIRIHPENMGVKYEIEDNGVGRDKANALKSEYRKAHRSKGMELLTKRFQLLSKEYHHLIETQITDLKTRNESSGTRVAILVPWEMGQTRNTLAS